MKGIFVEIADIKLLHGCSYVTAFRKMKVLRDSLSKEKHQGISIIEYCKYEGITIQEFTKGIEIRPAKSISI